ncbi:MAG: hypothetical protein ACRC0V_05020, partial [Fusobacteriaceae bacterium]
DHNKLEEYKKFMEKEGISFLFFDEANELTEDVELDFGVRRYYTQYILSCWNKETLSTVTLKNSDWEDFKKQVADYFLKESKDEN